jgi:hypothetical protein
MSQLERQKEERRGKSTQKKTKKTAPKPIFTYHPDKAVGEGLRNSSVLLEHVILHLGERVESGCKITISQPDDRSVFFVLIKEPGENWQETLGVSVWHSDLVMALRGLHYYLTSVNPEWPDIPAATQLSFADW